MSKDELTTAILALLCVVLLTVFVFGVSKAEEETHPYVQYQHSTWRHSDKNRKITAPEGCALNQGNSYEWVETEQGYDLVLHFVEVEE